jgi:phage host-nuclease inhibitor protein Gam
MDEQATGQVDVTALKMVREQIAAQLRRMGERQQELADLMARLGQSDAVATLQEELAAQQELLEREQEELTRVQAQLEGTAPALSFKLSDLQEKMTKVVAGVGTHIDEAFSTLKDRTNVVMVRVDQDTAAALDALVEAGVAKSRSQSAAFLLREGIKAQSDLFGKISAKISEIQRLKDELRTSLGIEPDPPTE